MNEHCKCEASGFCDRHGVFKTNREVELCRGVNCSAAQNAKYWNAWEKGQMPGQAGTPPQKEAAIIGPKRKARGVGDMASTFITKMTGIKPCGGCKDRAAILNQLFPFEKPPIQTHEFSDVRRNVCFHIWPVKGYNAWQWNCDQLIKYQHLFNGKRIIGIVRDKQSESPEVVKEYLKDFTTDFIVERNRPRLREVVTFVPMLERVESTDPNEVTFYCHSKSVRHKYNVDTPGVTTVKWAKAMWETLCEDWPAVEAALKTHGIAGSFKRYGQFRTRYNHRWHFSGAFYWFRHDSVFNRNWRYIDRRFFGAESWPGHMFLPEEAACIFADNIGDLYQHDYWQQSIQPQLTEWRNRHATRTHSDC